MEDGGRGKRAWSLHISRRTLVANKEKAGPGVGQTTVIIIIAFGLDCGSLARSRRLSSWGTRAS